ncbi:MAG: hypothetical protein JOY81_05020 [Alphaproteobacteria bacterium]|nr:hypothetical protein [Alphaproteobacteria bacterium]
MTFQKGHPGGPGRPRGSRSRINLLLDELAADNVQEILAKVVEAARGGDRKAQDIVLKRLWTVPRGRPVEVDLPPVETPEDLMRAHAALTDAIAAREVTAEEAGELVQVLDAHRRAFELLDHEKRIAAIQEEMKEGE